ncbi:MAG: hypothetical protein NVSMB13_10840 [Mycobacteriales bacterium]
MAARLQALMKGIGTNGDTWSQVMSQYCDGVSYGAASCPASANHVAYPTPGGVLAGVWTDSSAPAPNQATGKQIAAEAIAGAQQFGNTTAVANRNAQYVVVSPSGTDPDGFHTNDPASNFCAWHDWTGDTALPGGQIFSPVGPLAFTNLPYIPDMGSECGANEVNAGTAGALDGVSIIAGDEYAETITDPFPAGGWVDANNDENGDKCMWVVAGSPTSATAPVGAQNIQFATGNLPMQSTWSNDSSSCLLAHAPAAPTGLTSAIGTRPDGTVDVTLSWTASPGAQTYTVKRAGADGQYAAITSTSALSFTDPSRPPGVLTTYVVTATSNGLTSPNSTPAAGFTGGTYHPLNPVRLLDTRVGTGVTAGKLGPDQSLRLQIAGAAGGALPTSGLSAVTLNVTAVQASAASYLSVYPTGYAGGPGTSNLNLVAGQTLPNLVVSKVADDGTVTIYNHAGYVDVVVDVEGYYSADPAATTYHPLNPARVLDTRDGTGGTAARLGPGQSVQLQIAGAAGGALPAGGIAAVTST